MSKGIPNPMKGQVARNEQRVAATGAKVERVGASLTGDRATNALQSISSKAYGIWSLEMMLAAPGVLLGMALAKMGFKRAGAVFKMAKAPIRALNTTSLENIHQLRGRTLESAAVSAQITGGKALGMTEKLRGASEKALMDDARRAGKVMDTLQPVRRSVGKGIEKLEGTGTGNFLKDMLTRMTKWRVTVNEKKAPALVGTAHERLEALLTAAAPKEGLLDGLKTQGAKAKDAAKLTQMQSLFTPLQGMLDESKQLLAAGDKVAHAAHLEEIGKAAVEHSQKLVGTEAKEMMRVGSMFSRAATGTAILHGHETALKNAGTGMKTLVKNLGHMGGRMSVLQAVIAVGAVTGAAAAWTMAKHQNKTGEKALDDLTHDLGGDKNHPMVVAAKEMHAKQQGGRLVAAGAQTVGEGINVGFTAGGGSMLMMAAQAGLPQVANMLVPQNELLNAYATLQEAERTGAKLEQAQKVELVKHLVAAVPDAAKHGGIYARLTEPTAVELVKRNLPLREMLQVLGDPKQFEALAVQGKAALDAQQAAAKTAEQPKAAPVPAAANENLAVANDNAAKPSLKISAERSHEGRVEEHQRALA